MSVLAPRTRFRSLVDPRKTTRDPVLLQERVNDPIIQHDLTAGWFWATQHAIQLNRRAGDRIRIPVLVLQGAADQIVDPAATVEWSKSLASLDKTIHLIPDHLHELLHEPDRAETLSLIFEWMEERVPTGG